MQMTITIGNQTFTIDRELLLNFLIRNGAELSSTKKVVKEINDDKHSDPRSLLHG